MDARSGLVLCVVAAAALTTSLFAEEPSDAVAALRAVHLARMKEVAASIHVYSTPERKAQVDLVPEPVLRYADNTRQIHESSLWIWGKAGRPSAILAIEFYTNEPRGPRWLYEIASLSTERIAVQRRSDLNWTADEPGLDLQPITGADPAADRPARRLLQMKELQRRFGAHEWTPGEGRIQLRPLATPLHRYESSKDKLIDGAIFSFANGTNPEIFLVLEAHQESGNSATWKFGLAQMTGAVVTVELDGKTIWNRGEADPPAIRASYANGWIAADATQR